MRSTSFQPGESINVSFSHPPWELGSLCVCVCVCVCVCACGRVCPLVLLMFFLFSRVAVEQLRLLPRLRRRVLANFFWTSTFVSSQFHPHT